MPQETLAILDELDEYEFTDAHFYSIHHFSVARKQHITVRGMRDYIDRGIKEFTSDTNLDLKKRLKMLLAMLKAGQFTKPPKLGVLYALCLAVVAEVPLRDSSKT
jgi:hypothetical protein